MKFLHTMIRVNNLEESLDFFCNKLGLIETRRKDVPEGKFTLIFLAATEDENSAINTRSPEIELTHNWDYEDLDKGRNFGHLAFSVPNIYETCQKLMDKGVVINRPPRDGRSDKRAYAYLTTKKGKVLNDNAIERLKVLKT